MDKIFLLRLWFGYDGLINELCLMISICRYELIASGSTSGQWITVYGHHLDMSDDLHLKQRAAPPMQIWIDNKNQYL